MKLKLGISKETKETLLGGIAGGLTFYMESAANGLVAGYPQVLKDRLITQAPRNGELVATLAPVGITYALAKKKPSSKIHNVRNGVMFYDLPRLMGLVAYRLAYTAGLPSVGSFRASPMVMVRPTVYASQVAPQMTGAGGRYAMKGSVSAARSSGIGKYAV